MKFLYPAFLYALFAIAIPILIHLFSFRRYKTVYFSHVGFLKDIKKESQKKSRLKQLLILLARILTILFLVLAFSQPFLPSENEAASGSNQVVGVYVDNSFSMNALSEEGQLLERSRSKAAEIAQSYPPGTRFQLLTNDLEPRHQHLFNREQFIREVTGVKTSPVVLPVSRIHNRFEMQSYSQESTVTKTLYCLSDFQRNITDIENFSGESVYTYFMPLIPNQVNNLYIDSCWVEVPAHGLNQEETVFVRIKNSSDEDYQNLPLRLFLNDSLKSMTNYSVNARNEITASLKYRNVTSGIQKGRVEITNYPFTHDNTWYLSYFVEPRLKTLAIYNNTSSSMEGLAYISALFRDDDYVDLETMDIQSLQISRLAEYSTLFLIQPENFTSGFINELEQVIQSGTSVVLFPNSSDQYLANNLFLSRFGANSISGKDTTTQEISGIDIDNRFFRNVFREREQDALFPKIGSHLKFSEQVRTPETSLLWFQNGDKALSVLPYGKGKVWVFAFPLNRQNELFARDALFVPSIYNIVLNSLPDMQISYTIGKEQFYFLPRNINVTPDFSIEIESTETGDRFIPGISISEQGMRLDLSGFIETAGHYLVKNDNDVLASISFNYERNESDLRYFSPDELKERIEMDLRIKATVITNVTAGFSEVLQEIQRGKQFWKICIVLSLIFILAEVLIARFWKV